MPRDCQLTAPRPLFGWVTNFLKPHPSCSCGALAPACCGAHDLQSKALGGDVSDGGWRKPRSLGWAWTPGTHLFQNPRWWHVPWSWSCPVPLRHKPKGEADGSEEAKPCSLTKLPPCLTAPALPSQSDTSHSLVWRGLRLPSLDPCIATLQDLGSVSTMVRGGLLGEQEPLRAPCVGTQVNAKNEDGGLGGWGVLEAGGPTGP